MRLLPTIYYFTWLTFMVPSCRTDHDSGQPCPGPPDKGPCNRQIYKWAYDPDKDTCMMFVWGGCAGNDKNRFDTEFQCLQRCSPSDCEYLGQDFH